MKKTIDFCIKSYKAYFKIYTNKIKVYINKRIMHIVLFMKQSVILLLVLFIMPYMINAGYAQSAQNIADSTLSDTQKQPLDIPEINIEKELFFDPLDKENNIPKAAETTPVNVSAIEFEGNSIYDDKTLSAYTKDLINKDIVLSDLFDVTQKITTLYRNDGYILTTVVIPPQEIEKNGVAKIQIIEGYVGSYEIAGDTDQETVNITNILNKVTQQRPLNISKLERYLLLLNDLNGVTAKASFVPSDDDFGASHLVLNLTRKKTEASIQTNNMGSRFSGRDSVKLSGAYNNVFKHDEKITASYQRGTGNDGVLNSYVVSYNSLIHENGVTLNASIATTKTEIGGPLKASNIKGDSNNINVGVNWAYIRQRARNITLNAALSDARSTSTSDGAVLNKDRVQNLSLGALGQFTDTQGVTAINLQVLQGLGLVDSDVNLQSRSFGETDATKIKFSLVRENLTPTNNLTIFTMMTGQYAFDDVLSADEFSFGGSTFGRGYESSEISGDSGVGISLETRYKKSVRDNNQINKFVDAYLLYGFVDFGQVHERDRDDGRGSYNISILSAGVGARFDILNNGTLQMTYAKPLTKNVESYGDKPSRVYADLSFKF